MKESHWIFEITVQLAETSIDYSKYSTYDTSAMEKLLQVADQHASKVDVTEDDVYEVLFLQFMEKNPICSFYSMSKDEYLSKSKKERVSLILKYCSEVKNGENSIFSFCIWLWVLFLLTQNFWTILLSVAASSPVKTAKKANVLYLSKEAMNKDQKLKMLMLMSTEGENAKNSENVWHKPGFLGDQKGEFTIFKVNFPENTLVYANQRAVSLSLFENLAYFQFLSTCFTVPGSVIKKIFVSFALQLT